LEGLEVSAALRADWSLTPYENFREAYMGLSRDYYAYLDESKVYDLKEFYNHIEECDKKIKDGERSIDIEGAV